MACFKIKCVAVVGLQFSHDGLKERLKSLKMACAKAIRLFLILVLISVFIYWAIGAFLKYEQEPISTSTEYRLGDDDLGNFSLPIFTFFFIEKFRILKCGENHRAKIWTEGTTAASISCMQDYDNVTAFLKDNHVPNPMKCKRNCVHRVSKIKNIPYLYSNVLQ